MIQSEFGRSGYTVSKLGFGAMRLPMVTLKNKDFVDIDKAVDVLRHSFESGVNYLDTAFMYCNSESEVACGRALRGWRDKITLTTKATSGNIAKPGDLLRQLEHQLRKLDVDYLDFYCFHGIGWDGFHALEESANWRTDMEQAKAEGLVKHIAFSFHDKPENMKRLVDLDLFDMVTCQYNYMDRSNSEGMQYAKDHGLGVVVMGPVGGGRLAGIPKFMQGKLDESALSGLAVRFAASHPATDVVLSGMGDVKMVDENASAIETGSLTDEEMAIVDSVLEETKGMADLYCTGCGYCMPCPHGVNIPARFDAMNLLKVYGFDGQAKRKYRNVMKKDKESDGGGVCISCGQCMDKCPQKIEIIDQLIDVDAAFTE
jgi:predicted aldo/keto reductase-like oxidoreductase